MVSRVIQFSGNNRSHIGPPVRFGGFFLWLSAMATIVQCNCGAEIQTTEEKFLIPHTGDAICTVCGAALESWSESTHVP